jgi:hypothetical protein
MQRIAVQPSARMPGLERPALNRLMAQGELQVAEVHLRQLGFDPGPIDGVFTAQTQAAVRAFQIWPSGLGAARSHHPPRVAPWIGPEAGAIAKDTPAPTSVGWTQRLGGLSQLPRLELLDEPFVGRSGDDPMELGPIIVHQAHPHDDHVIDPPPPVRMA